MDTIDRAGERVPASDAGERPGPRRGPPSLAGRPDHAPLVIAFAIQEWPTEGRPAGGAGIYVAKIAMALAQRGHHVHVVTCAHVGVPADRIEAGVSVHRLEENAPNAKDPESLIRYSRAVAKRLRDLDAEHAFDVVEFQEWAAEGWAFHARRDQAMVVRLQAPSHFVRQFEYADGTAAERRVDELERWPIERADLVTAPSRLIARFAARQWTFDPEAATIIPNGVDARAFGRKGGRPAPAGPKSDPIVLCVNRLSPIKGPEVFVRAAARVHQEFPAARFRMVGRIDHWNGGPGDECIRQLAVELGLPCDRLEIMGPVEHRDLPDVYAGADVCVNPSMSESYSLTSAEALAAGKACVLSDAMGITELLTDGEDCLLAPAGDAAAFAERMSRLLRDESLRRRVATAARRTVEKRLSTDATAVETEAAYRGAIARVRKRPALPAARLNVAILTYNAIEYTKRCLESIARHTELPYHLFVLDNASTDGTRPWLASLRDPRIHVTFGDKNLGVPGGRNALLKTIFPYLGDDGFVVFLDNDLELFEGWYAPYFTTFEDRPRAGIAGEIGHPFIVHEDRRELLPMPASTPADVDVASGGFCCFVRAPCAREVGLFDEKLGLFWHEDDDYCVRAIMHGWDVLALKTGRVVHHEHQSGVALPAVLAGGSPGNQRYLAAKWRALGLVDETGRITRRAHDATFALRTRLARRLGRGDPIPQDELERAVRDLSALLMSGDVMKHIEMRTADLSPTLRALLDVNIEQADAQGNLQLRAALEEVRGAVRQCRFSALLRPHVDLPARPTSPPRCARRLSKVCDAGDWDAPEWRALATSIYGDGGGRNWYARHRKLWEAGQVSFALEKVLEAPAMASGLVVNAAAEPLVFGLANRMRSVTAADEYGADAAAPAAMLSEPERFSPFAFAKNRLWVVKMGSTRLGFPEESFDFVVLCALHRLRSEEAAIRALAECARVVRPGGATIIVTELGLNGREGPGLFVPGQLSRIVAASDLQPIEETDFSLTDATLDGFVDLARGADQRPHFVLAHGDVLFTSAVIVLERRAAAIVGTNED